MRLAAALLSLLATGACALRTACEELPSIELAAQAVPVVPVQQVASEPPTAPAPAETDDRPDPVATACAAKGGQMRAVGRAQALSCVIPYADAGKPCTDGSQCEGACWTSKGKPAKKATGMCQPDSTRFGCHGEVVKGRVTHFLCVD